MLNFCEFTYRINFFGKLYILIIFISQIVSKNFGISGTSTTKLRFIKT
jgi:hypothetical protein